MAGQKTELVKKANKEVEYSPHEIKELTKCAKDPIYCISNYFKVEHPKDGLVLFELRPYQKAMIDMFVNNTYSIMLCGRQLGKSQTSAAYLFWFAMFNPNKTILIASDKNSNALEIIYRIKVMYENAPEWLKPGVSADGWNAHSIKFDNKTRILSAATTEKTGRGLSISLLFCDELAFVGYKRKDDVARDFWVSISPTLSNGGKCIISSTPNNDIDLFSELWRGATVGTNGFAFLKVLWDQGPGRDENWKRQEIGRIGLEKFKREHECEFVGNDSLLISGITLSRLSGKEPSNIVRDFKFWGELEKGKSYVVGVDPATGTSLDYSVIEVFEFPNMVQVAEFRSNTTSSVQLYKALKGILSLLDKKNATTYFSIENNGVGEGLLALLDNDENPPDNAEFVSQSNTKRPGFNTNGKSKMSACLKFKEYVESDSITINSDILLAECKAYSRGKSAYEAKAGGTDDCISAVLICIRIVDEIILYDDKAYAQYSEKLVDDYFDEESYNENDPDGAPAPMVL